MPATSICSASSFEPRSGAKPPSSPTAVASPRADSVFFSAWKTSAPMRSASAKLGAPTGTTMNSWKATLLSACAPPFNTFIIGTGSTWAASPPRYRQSGRPSSAAAACAAASETPRIALAPRRALFGVPSSSMRVRSSPAWSVASWPATASAISPLTFPTACVTPLPPYGSPPSRSSVASNSPVEAPLGTAARPAAPERRRSSTSTVGLPRLSRIWRAWTVSIWLTVVLFSRGRLAESGLGVEGELVLARHRGPVLARLGGEVLGGLHAPAEARARRAQRKLGVDAQLARDVHRGEEHVADLVEQGVADLGRRARAGLGVIAGGADRVGQLGELCPGPGQRPLDPGEVEPGRRRPALDLARVQERRQVLRHVAEDPVLAAGLGALDLVPVAQHLAGGVGRGVAEDVRMAADQLRAAVLGDAGHVARAALLEQQREEVHLKEDVAELVEQLAVVAGVGGVGELVGLLDRVRDDRALVLLAVPGALAAQAAGQLVETGDGGGDVGLGHRPNPRGSAVCGSARRGGGRVGRRLRADVGGPQLE